MNNHGAPQPGRDHLSATRVLSDRDREYLKSIERWASSCPPVVKTESKVEVRPTCRRVHIDL